MKKRIILTFFLLLLTTSVWAKSRIHPKILFTWLAIGSTIVVVGLWVVFWNRRKRN